MSSKDISPRLFLDDEFEETKIVPDKVVCLGMEFPSEDARREYFRAELRKKLPELKQIEGFPIGEDDDIINLSDPPYYTACPNPWLNKVYSENNKNVLVPFSDDLSVDDRHSVYSYHPYHTKVPPTIIKKLIEYYTDEGDVVLDIFCGSGMTGVAARESNRTIIESDLSPIATFISAVNSTSFDTSKVIYQINKIIDKVENKLGWMYKTEKNNVLYKANYYVWSDVFSCPECCKEFPIFPYGVIHHGNKVETRKEFKCPHCGLSLNIRKINRVIESDSKKAIPVWVNAGQGKTRINQETNEYDLSLIDKINKYSTTENSSWFPLDVIDPTRYSAKLAQLGQKHISDISKFLSTRNLIIYAELWSQINELSDIRIRNACKSMMTSIFTVVSERQGYFGGGGGMSGNLYMPIVRMEKNIFDSLRRKIKKFQDSEGEKPSAHDNHFVTTQSSNSLSNISSSSVDFIFTDPPFGANIMYSEMNLLLEGWLRVKTNNKAEAVIDETGNKSFFDYNKLLTECFSECFRVLKPGHWMCVEFHNTQASIWNLLQNAINSAGFIIAQVLKLDKGSTTILADIRPGAAVQDLLINCYKSKNETGESCDIKLSDYSEWDFIDEHLQRLPLAHIADNVLSPTTERSSRILFDRMVAYFLIKKYNINLDITEFQKGLDERYLKRDGMYFTSSQAIEYETLKSKIQKFIPMSLYISSESEGIEWLKRQLSTEQTYKELHPKWIRDLVKPKKGDVLPELMSILEENFIKDEEGNWRNPDPEKAADLEIIRNRRMMKEFNMYLEQAQKPKAKRMKDTRLEVLRYGFKECYKQKDYQAIVTVGDHILESLLQEDEVLLQYYDIASSRI